MCIECYSFNKQFEYLLDMRCDIWLMYLNDPYIVSLPSRAPKMVPMAHMKEETIRPKVNMSFGFRHTFDCGSCQFPETVKSSESVIQSQLCYLTRN